MLANITSGGVGAQEVASALSPSGVLTPAGSHILFFDRANLLVLDPSAGVSAQWVSLVPPNGSAFDDEFECSADGKGNCVVGLVTQGEKRVGIVDVGRKQILDTGIRHDGILAVQALQRIFIFRLGASGARHVLVVDGELLNEVPLGTMSKDEELALLPIDGVLTPVFVSKSDQVRFPGSDVPTNVSSGLIAGRSTSSSGVFIANDLFQKYDDGRDRAVFGLGFYSRDRSGALTRSIDGMETFLPSEDLPLPSTYTIDRVGNVIGLTARENGLRLTAPCVLDEASGGTRRARKQIRAFPALTRFEAHGSGRGEGIVLQVREPGEAETLFYVQFAGDAPSRFGGKSCAAVDVRLSPLPPVPGTSIPEGWKESVYEVMLRDGTKVSGTLLRREGVDTQRLIIDAYGASGLLRSQLNVPSSFLGSEKMRSTAIYYPVLPGDGNKGWASAAASRSPERSRAISTLAEVTSLAKSDLLASGGKTYLRGGSAGGWLAVKTALANPGLVDEVISISGAYSFEREDDAIRLANFFRVEDSITNSEVASCGTTFFRLIHGTEDQTVPFARVQKFGGLLSANKCKGALHIAEGGTHNLTDFTTYRSNPNTRSIANWAHGIE
jgi:predicted esterase